MILDSFIFRSHLHEEEKLVYVVHQHWCAAYKSMVKVSLFGIAAPIVFWLMFPTTAALFIFGGWFLLGFAYFFYEVADWYLDVLLITNQGIIDLDWRGIFDKSSTRIDYDTVLGVTFEKVGFFSNIFNYGKLLVEKEGYGKEEVSLPMATSPQKAEGKIIAAREKYTRDRGLEDEKVLKDILAGMVKNHVRHKRENNLADII